jgi:mycothiol synthase
MIELEQMSEHHWPRVREMLESDPSLAWEFDALLAAGEFEWKWNDPKRVPEACLLARVDGELAGIALGSAFPQAGEREVGVLRIGVREAFRRRGMGAQLLERSSRTLWARPRVSGIDLVAWEPFQGAAEFTRAMGYRPVRTFWRMGRPTAPLLEVRWPDGVRTRTFDGSEAMLEEWVAAYNASFAEHFRYVPATPDSTRHLLHQDGFEPDGLIVAYRDGAPVGFCGNEGIGEEGLVVALGTAPAARGIGLGRALLRWSVAYHAGRGRAQCVLLVDGENDRALRLYRSEGFGVVRTRQIFERPRPA